MKQVPNWNKVVEEFRGKDDEVFGDVALSKNQVRQVQGVDQGPSSAYPKKTSQTMCDELGPKTEYAQQYIEEQGGTSLCNVSKMERGCTEKQKEYTSELLEEVQMQPSMMKEAECPRSLAQSR